MERSLERFVEDQNIARYTDHLTFENDPVKRNALLRLLRIEEANRSNHVEAQEKEETHVDSPKAETTARGTFRLIHIDDND